MTDKIICEECGLETDGFFLCDDCEEEVFAERTKQKKGESMKDKLTNVENTAYMTIEKPKLDKTFAERLAKASKYAIAIDTCLVPLCATAAMSKNLCAKHYQHARRLVKNKDVTWKTLYKNGKAVKKVSKITQWFLSK